MHFLPEGTSPTFRKIVEHRYVVADGLYVADLRGAQVDRKGVIYLKDGRRMEFTGYGKK